MDALVLAAQRSLARARGEISDEPRPANRPRFQIAFNGQVVGHAGGYIIGYDHMIALRDVVIHRDLYASNKVDWRVELITPVERYRINVFFGEVTDERHGRAFRSGLALGTVLQ